MLWLKIARLCKEFNVLPWQGGLLQQPHSAINRLELVLNANAKYEEIEREKDKKLR